VNPPDRRLRRVTRRTERAGFEVRRGEPRPSRRVDLRRDRARTDLEFRRVDLFLRLRVCISLLLGATRLKKTLVASRRGVSRAAVRTTPFVS
jgi:hypothetical protein